MTEPEYFSPQEIQAICELSGLATTLPDGSVTLEKAGIIGAGPSTDVARLEWGRKFAEMIARPKHAAP
jgi:hypothetical protein